MQKIIAIGIASIVETAKAGAANYVGQICINTPPWEPVNDCIEQYHGILNATINQYVEPCLKFAKENGYNELATQYEDGLITAIEFLTLLSDKLTNEYA